MELTAPVLSQAVATCATRAVCASMGPERWAVREATTRLLSARKASATGCVNGRLIRAIDRCEILSLDVFDTAILRRVEQRTDVFELVAGQYRHLYSPQVGWDFARARVDAERLARERASA